MTQRYLLAAFLLAFVVSVAFYAVGVPWWVGAVVVGLCVGLLVARRAPG